MENISHNVLVFDEEKFSSVAKSLHKQLSTEDTKLTLSKTQEVLAKSLGFRNLSGIKTFWNKKEKSSIRVLNKPPFTGLSASKWYSLLLFLMNDKEDVWVKKSLPLMKAILPLVVYEEEKGEPVTAKTIKRGLDKLKDKFRVMRYTSDYPEEVLVLKNYFDNVPDYKNDSVEEEQFNYLLMQWIPVLNTLQEIEDNDFVLVPQKLIKILEADTIYRSTLKQIRKDDKLINVSEASNEIKRLAVLKEDFWNWPYLRDGWLDSEEDYLYDFIKLKIYEKNMEDIKLSDFLLYSSTLLREKQLHKYRQFLSPILLNVAESKKYSEKLREFVNGLK